MTSADPGVRAVLELLAQLRSEREQLKKRMREELAALEDKINAVETTLALLTRAPAAPGAPKPHVTAADLAGSRSQMDALKRIAGLGDGMVNASEAARLLLEAGMAKGKLRNVVAHIYKLLKGSDEWEWVSPGNFRLRSEQQQ